MRTCNAMLTGSLVMVGLVTSALAADPRSVQKQVSAEPSGDVMVSNVNGSIDVTAWDQPQVAATAELHGQELGLDVNSSTGGTEVRITGYPRFGGSDLSEEAMLTVHVPRASRLTVSAVSAAVHSTGVQGAQRLQSVSGAVKADLAAAAVTVHTVSGSIELNGDGHDSNVDANSVSGTITLQNGGGDLHAQTVSGKVQATLSPAHQVTLHSISGDVTVTGSLARDATLEAHSISGGVHINTKTADGFSYQVRSFSGHLDDCFGVPAESQNANQDRYGPASRALSGSRGTGSAKIRVNTMSGDVSLCDK